MAMESWSPPLPACSRAGRTPGTDQAHAGPRKQSEWQTQFIDISNFFFTMVFGWECMSKIYALHSRCVT
eukprot:1976887-Rhodomonas_salina.4